MAVDMAAMTVTTALATATMMVMAPATAVATAAALKAVTAAMAAAAMKRWWQGRWQQAQTKNQFKAAALKQRSWRQQHQR
jgi:hypothetical protein